MSIYIYVCWVHLVIKSYKLLISCCIYKVMFVRLLNEWMKEVKHRIMFVGMLFRDEFIIMLEWLDVHLFIWKQILHILNCRHEYGNINDTVTLLKQINTPALLLPYEQMYIQLFHHNNELVPEQHPNKHNPMFDFLHSNTTRHNPPDA